MKYNDPHNRAIIGGCRCCGKSTELIKMAARFNCLIISATPQRAQYLNSMAENMGLYIEHPITIREHLANPERLRGKRMTLLVDDVEDVISALFHQNVAVISTSANLEPMRGLKEEENDAT